MKPEHWEKAKGADPLNIWHRWQPRLTPDGIPIIEEQEIAIPTRLIKYKDYRKYQTGDALHFFVDDYHYEHLWKSPTRYLPRLEGKTLLSPDFSLYADWPEPLQRFNLYRSRWLAAFWQHQGMTVIPSLSWSDDTSYDWCFSGLPEGGIVAVSTAGCMGARDAWTAGFEAMLDRLEPDRVLCYGNIRKIYTGRRLLHQVVPYFRLPLSYQGNAAIHERITSY